MASESLLNMFLPAVHFPGSGNVEFRYHPYTKWEAPALIRGDERVEQRVYTEVASAGRQLGRITEVVLQLASATDLDTAELRQLRDWADDVESIKASVEDRTERDARTLLDRLAATDIDRLRAVLAEYEARAAAE